jgi:hypothetical protein
MRPAVRRIIWAFVIGAVLIAVVISLLTYADTFDLGERAGRCGSSQWRAYVGCAMAAHEDLAAGLFGGAGALFAAWLAFDAIQEQLGEEQERRRRQQIEAKKAAVASLTRVVASAGAAFVFVGRAIASDDLEKKAEVEKRLHEGGVTSLIEDALNSFLMKDIPRDLGIEDRINFLQIVDALATIVSVCRASEPSPRVHAGCTPVIFSNPCVTGLRISEGSCRRLMLNWHRFSTVIESLKRSKSEHGPDEQKRHPGLTPRA